jgi:hypothetical protein
VAGLAVVRVHNYRASDWAVLVTLLGWLLLLGCSWAGWFACCFRSGLPQWLANLAQNTGSIAGEAVVLLVLGVVLSYQACMNG